MYENPNEGIQKAINMTINSYLFSVAINENQKLNSINTNVSKKCKILYFLFLTDSNMIKRFKNKSLPKKFKTSFGGTFNERRRDMDATKHVLNRWQQG